MASARPRRLSLPSCKWRTWPKRSASTRITIRLRNCLRDGDLLATQSPVPGGVSVAELLELCARQAGAIETSTGWRLPDVEQVGNLSHTKKRGLGLAVSMKNAGFSFGFPERQHGAGGVVW